MKTTKRKMLKTTCLSAIFLLGISALNAQGTLQFNRVLMVSNIIDTVPVGKVWKVTSVYGAEARYNECVDITASSTHELSRLRCAYTVQSGNYNIKVPYYTISTFIVNGVNILSSVTGLPIGNTSFSRYSQPNCTGSQYGLSRNWSCANLESDPNILPIWLAAGTTVKSGGPNTYLSVIEFNVVP